MSTANVEQISIVEAEAQALHRLAAQAHERGIRIVINQVTNHHFATSSSNRDKLHAVTLYSCDCRGFLTHSRCMHYAAILEMYHSLPVIETPDTSGPDNGPDGGGAALPVPADVLISIIPAPRRSSGPRVENPHTVTKPLPWNRSETLDHYVADGIEIDGRMHRVGDRVRYAFRKGERATKLGTISAIYRTTATSRRWKVTFRENDFARYVADVQAVAVSCEEVPHAA